MSTSSKRKTQEQKALEKARPCFKSVKWLQFSSLLKNISKQSHEKPISSEERLSLTQKGSRKSQKIIAFITILTFTWSQIVWAEGANPYSEYQAQSVQPETVLTQTSEDAAGTAEADTTVDFLAGDSPLSPASTPLMPPNANETYDEDGKLRRETNSDGTSVFHVYQNESIQDAIDTAQTGDAVLVHAGEYHGHYVLKDGVSLKGENAETTVLNGDYAPGSPVIRAFGHNQISGFTITGARSEEGQILGAVSIEGEGVQVRENRIRLNLCAGVHVAAEVPEVLIERNLFFGNPTAIETPRSENVIRFNTIANYEENPFLRISNIRYMPGQGFTLQLLDPPAAFSYFIEYSNDYGATWQRVRQEVSSGVFEDYRVLKQEGGTSWLDDGSMTYPHPLEVDVRWYRFRVAESFMGQIGIDVQGNEAPKIYNNIITHQTLQSIREETPGSSAVLENIFFHNQENAAALMGHLPPAIGSGTGEGWTGGNVLADPGFMDPAKEDYSVSESSFAYGKGAFVPDFLIEGLVWGAQQNEPVGARIIQEDGRIAGCRIFWSESSYGDILNDGTQIVYSNDKPLKEITPGHETVFYDDQGRVEKFLFSDGRTVRYLYEEPCTIVVSDPEGNILKEIALPLPEETDLRDAFYQTLENGIKLYYVDGELIEIRTSTGIRITHFVFDPENEIKEAVLVYPDGTREILWEGKVLRKVYSDGSMLDYLPTGWIVREILQDGIQYYGFQKLSQTEAQYTRIFTLEGQYSLFDGKGILREVLGQNGEHFFYDRLTENGSLRTVLNLELSSIPGDQALVGALYSGEGVLEEIRLQDGSRHVFTEGRLSSSYDALGQEVQYSAFQDSGFLSGLQVDRNGALFHYDENGFLNQIQTDSGVLERIREDANGDGEITDEDIVRLLLELVNGYSLSDFIFDDEGNLLNGLLTTQAGIVQRIENGVLTGFETVDGRIYDFQDGEALLREWKFQDGKRILFNGQNITEILFPDGRRLHTLGLDAQQNLKTYTEELADGTQKVFEAQSGQGFRLIKLILPPSDGRQIVYNHDGMAEKIILADGTVRTIAYAYDALGGIEKILLQDAHGQYEFTSEGTLLSIFQSGVNAELEAGEIARLYTRFGEIEQPSFNSDGKISGIFHFVDGAEFTITDGGITEIVYPGGTRVHYTAGRINSVQTSQGTYQLLYGENGSQLSSVRIRFQPAQPQILDIDNLAVASYGNISASSSSGMFSSGAIVLDGVGDYLVVEPGDAFDFGVNDFTIETWVSFSNLAQTHTIASKYVQDGQGWIFAVDTAYNQMVLYDSGWTRVLVPVVGGFEKDRWYHLSVVRHGNQILFFKDGVQQGSAQIAASNYNGDATPLEIGIYERRTSGLNGQMDELRISDIARWTGDFTPQTVAYEPDEHTRLLHHFETLGDAEQVTGVVSNPNGEFPLVPFLQAHPDESLSRVLFGRPLYNALENPEQIGSELGFSSGEQMLFFSSLLQDPERGTAYELYGDYFPEWAGITLDAIGYNGGYISRNVTMDVSDHLPAMTADLLDLNGDGFLDRVWADPAAGMNYWWVQFGTIDHFEAPVKWMGVERNHDVSAYPWYLGTWSGLRFYEGRHPHVLGNLIDLNGDGRPDRVFQKYHGEKEWYVQFNNGQGFDPVILWDTNIHPVSQWSFQATYASQVRDDEDGKTVQELIADLIDMDGDGLPDRIVRPWTGDFDHWFFQKNTGEGFADAVLWEGVDPGFCAGDEKMGGSLSWYAVESNFIGDLSKLIDLNGDGLTDRVLLKNENPADPASAMDWYIQLGNGHGFEPATLWDDEVRSLPGFPNEKIGSAIHVFKDWNEPRNVLADLIDVTGDGLPDRVTLASGTDIAQDTWWVEINTGSTFAPAVAWTGIKGTNQLECSISQDNENFRSYGLGRSPGAFHQTVDLKDINNDGVPDRLIFPENGSRWLVQFGTGSGFLPVQEMQIEGLETATAAIHSSHYDYLHVSLKTDVEISESQGTVRVTLGSAAQPKSYQIWTINTLTTAWQDFYLPLDPEKDDGASIHIEFIPAEGTSPEISVYTDNITFTSFRPPDAQDWLDRLLTDGTVLAEAYAERLSDLGDYLYAGEETATAGLDWQELLQAETRIEFNEEGDAERFESLYGSISQMENGQVVSTQLPNNGGSIHFEISGENVQTVTQQITNPDGSTSTQTLSYGRVREIVQPDGTVLNYSYEFCGSTAASHLCAELTEGAEITAVTHPSTQTVERYRQWTLGGRTFDQLISRTQTNGIEVFFEYNERGELFRSSILYKGRVRETFGHSVTADGHSMITTEAGVREEYDSEGTLLFHTTPEGYRYAHTFEPGKEMVTTWETVTETFADGTTLTLQIPHITLTDPLEGSAGDSESIHRVTLTDYTDTNGNRATYGTDPQTHAPNVLKALELSDGTRFYFNQIETRAITDPETQESQAEILLLDVKILHADGSVTEFKNGQPFSITSAAGRTISLLTEAGPNGEELLLDPAESAAFHLAQAKTLWQTLVLPEWEAYKLQAVITVQSEYTLEGELVTRQFAEGTLELYNDDGKIEQVLSPEGERLILYTYDTDGNPVDIDMEGSRRRLESAILRLKAEVAVEREEALAAIADREQVLSQTIEGEYLVQRDRLLLIRTQIEAQKNQIASIEVKGKQARGMIADTMMQIQAGLDQVNAALEQLAHQREQSLAQLASQVQEAHLQIETESQNAYDQLQAEAVEIRRSILEQEIMPVVYHWYREILGRDPNKTEYDAVVGAADYETGTFDLEGLKQSLLNGGEYAARSNEVSLIKTQVMTLLENYLLMDAASRADFLADLGIPAADLAEISTGDAEAMREWLAKQSLHFGQSAFLALEGLIRQQITDYSPQTQRIALASDLILIDILTGTLTPFEQGDLVISMYAMRLVAKKYSVDVTPYAMTYDVLRGMYLEVCGLQSSACSLRVVAHINGNHYVIITNVTDTEVTYIDPGIGPEADAAAGTSPITVSRDDFLAVWVNAKAGQDALPEDGWGYVLSPRPPPSPLQPQIAGGDVLGPLSSSAAQYRVLETSEQMSVRGAFFPFLIFIVTVIINAIVAAVSAVIATISMIVGGLVAGIGSIASGFGALVTGLFSGNFLAGIEALFQGIAAGLGQIAGGIVGGIVQMGQGLFAAFTGLHAGLAGGISQALGTGFLGSVFSGAFHSGFLTGMISTGLVSLELQGAMGLLGAIGISPQWQGSFMSGLNAVMGIGLMFVPGGQMAGLGMITGGVSGFLNQYTDLSPALTSIISIGAAGLGAFAGGFFDAGSITGAISGLQSSLPFLSMELASAGLAGLGGAFDWNPMLTGLLDIPLRAAVGSSVGYFTGDHRIPIGRNELGEIIYALDSRSFLEYVTDSVFSSSTLGGIISVGTQLGLDAIGVPGWIGSFLPNLLNQITLGLGGNSDPQTADENILNRIWNNISKFGSGLWGAIGDVVSLGADILKQGYEAVRNTFGSLFSREVQETLYEAATAGPIGAGAGWALSSRTENYDANDNLTSVVEIFSNTAGDRTTIVTGVQTGNYTIQREMANGNWFQEVYEGVTRGAQGGFGFSSVAFAQETPDGIRIDQTIYDSDDYTVSLSDAVSGYDLYEYQIADGEIASFEQSLQAFAYGNDVSRLRAANPQDIVLADLGGFQLSQLEGLNYTVNFNHNTGETSISIPVASETNTQFLSQIQSILQQTGQNIQQYTEKIKNGFALLGSRTDAEIAQHKAAEISEVLSDPGKIYVIHTQTDSRTSYLTRQATRLGTSDYSVNHSALAFKDKDGKVFIIEIQMDGHAQSGLNTDVLVRPFEEWAAPYIDIDAQPLPISAEQADAFRQNVIFGKYVNESTMTPKIQLYYDFPGALVGEGAGIPIPGQGSKKFCSELVADLIFEGFGREIQPLDNDSYVSPNELQRRIEEWIASQQGSNEGKS